MPIAMRIEKRGDKWVVLPESGDKILGEHDTREAAEAQLRAIEAHKHAMATAEGALHHDELLGERKEGLRVVTVPAWRFSVSTGRWDQFAKLGDFEKDGARVVFDERTLGEIIENFGGRRNDIGMDYEHQALNAPLNGQPAPALAWYSALALVIGGQVRKFETHDPAVQPPDVTGLDDGLYGYRAQVTPLGEKLLPNYRYISPAFATEGADEQGRPIGYDLLNVAATCTPFLDGMAPIEMRRIGASGVQVGMASTYQKLQRSCPNCGVQDWECGSCHTPVGPGFSTVGGDGRCKKCGESDWECGQCRAPLGMNRLARMARDSQGVEINVGDRVSIDKIGEGTVTAVDGDTVRIRVPGATPEEESFNPREIEFWRVRKMTRGKAIVAFGPLPALSPEQQAAYEAWLSEKSLYDTDRNLAYWITEVQTRWPELARGQKRAGGFPYARMTDGGDAWIGMAVRVETEEYEWSHGKKPKGAGLWWFLINGSEDFQYNGPYGEALEAAKKKAAESGGAAPVVRVRASRFRMARTSGNVYHLERGADWRSSPDDDWETVVRTVDGEVVGRRQIDGATVVVISSGGEFFAALPQNVSMDRTTGARHVSLAKRTIRDVRQELFDIRAQDGKHVRITVDGATFEGTVRDVRQRLTFERRDQDVEHEIEVHYFTREKALGAASDLRVRMTASGRRFCPNGHEVFRAKQKPGVPPGSFWCPTESKYYGEEKITMEKSPMDPKTLMAKLGLADDAPVEEKLAKFAHHFASGDATPEEMKAMADSLDEYKDNEGAAKMSAHFKRFAEEPVPFAAEETPEEEKKERDAIAGMARSLGLPEGSRPSEIAVAFAAKTAPLTTVADLQGKVARLEEQLAARGAAETAARAQAFARQAIADGRTTSDKAKLVEETFVKSGEKAAEALLFQKGTFTVMRRYTAGGEIPGKESPPTSDAQPEPDDIRGRVAAKANEIMEAARKAGAPIAYGVAMTRVRSVDPELYAAYAALGTPSR